MCGRFALYTDPRKLAMRFKVEAPPELHPRYNVAPSQVIPIVRQEGEGRRFALCQWGLLPHWAKDRKFGYSTINARAETVAEKPTFRDAFRHRRCIVPADLYFEWQALPHEKVKQPWAIGLKNPQPMGLAGLWEHWTSPEGETVESFSIIVTDGNELTRPIHDRMPVILSPSSWDLWLDTSIVGGSIHHDLLKPFPSEEMTCWPIGTRINSPQHDDAACLERV